jgi:hypothetical protein
VRRVVLVGLSVLALVATGAFTAADGRAASRPGAVWFLRDGEPVALRRTAPSLEALVRALLAGPTAVERRRGVRTAIPTGTRVRSIEIGRGVATVNLAARFTAGTDRVSLRNRVGQLVRTVLGRPEVVSIRVRIEGGVPVGLFPDYDLRRPVSAPFVPREARPTVRDTQLLLADLGFMDRTGVTGSLDTQSSTALLGFQKWVGLSRDGILTDATRDALRTATRPRPALRAPGHRIEVHLDRQLALLIENGRVERVVHVSSGAFGKTPTGSFHVFRKERYSWSVPFKVWLPWASYFVGGVAFHEFGSVPIYAASHGCVRVNHYDARVLYEFARTGTQVDVLHEARV